MLNETSSCKFSILCLLKPALEALISQCKSLMILDFKTMEIHG